jgi:hypothetical protein
VPCRYRAAREKELQGFALMLAAAFLISFRLNGIANRYSPRVAAEMAFDISDLAEVMGNGSVDSAVVGMLWPVRLAERAGRRDKLPRLYRYWVLLRPANVFSSILSVHLRCGTHPPSLCLNR